MRVSLLLLLFHLNLISLHLLDLSLNVLSCILSKRVGLEARLWTCLTTRLCNLLVFSEPFHVEDILNGASLTATLLQ